MSDTPKKYLRAVLRFYAVLVALTGLVSFLFFFPSPDGCSDKFCLAYSFYGMFLLVLSIGIFFLKRFAMRVLLFLSFGFACYFSYEIVHIWRTDHTGQGLVGLVLLAPYFIIGGLGLVAVLFPDVKNELN